MNKKLKFEFKRSTKGTHLYIEVDTEVVGSIYIRKASLPEAPEFIYVTIETS